MTKIKNRFLTLYKKLFKKKVKCAVVVSLFENDNLQIDLMGFKNPKNNEELADYIKIIYVLFSESFEDALINAIAVNFKNNPTIAQQIVGNVALLIDQYEPEDDENDPIVDPCSVFAKKEVDKNMFEE